MSEELLDEMPIGLEFSSPPFNGLSTHYIVVDHRTDFSGSYPVCLALSWRRVERNYDC
jgi:hypothetical protein